MTKKTVKIVPILALLAVLAFPPEATSRLDPLSQMTSSSIIRPDIMILFDNSGSMIERVTDNTTAGNDCSGSLAGWMVASDGLCAGTETAAPDCNTHSQAKCYLGSTTESRAWRAKSALRNILPDLRTVANLALASYGTMGLFTYYQGTTATPTKTTIFLHEWELRSSGSWTGNVWSSGPPATIPVVGSATEVYKLVNSTDLGTSLDSLYRRSTGTAYVMTRANYASWGPSHNDGTYDWAYVGSFYWYNAYDATATSSLVSPYKGPRFTSDGGTTWWEYKRFTSAERLTGTGTGAMLNVGFPANDTQAASNTTMGKLLNWINMTNNGGISATVSAGTPGVEAIQDIQGWFSSRIAADTAAGITNRPRKLIIFSDGNFTTGSPAAEVRELYCLGCNDATSCNSIGPNATNCDPATSSPVLTQVISVLPTITDAAEKAMLDDVADAGDNGADDDSTTADYTASEKALVDAVKSGIANVGAGDYATGSPSASTSGTTTATGDWAILPSTEYPGWKGHLRAFDLTTNPPTLKWDAGELLNSTNLPNPFARRIFTGHPTSDLLDNNKVLGDPIEILDTAGDWNQKGAKTLNEIRRIGKLAGSVYFTDAAVATKLTDAQMLDFFKWLYGEKNGTDRGWRLPPIIRCTPAVIGMPFNYGLTDHATFAVDNGGREKLVYVTSNEGLIHAFRSGEAGGTSHGGEEVFAYIPPSLFDAAYALYLQGGQSDNLANFKWVLAGSPRVDDVYNSTDDDPMPAKWFTEMVVATGPINHGLIALDISNPTDCATEPCTLRPRPFNVRALLNTIAGAEQLVNYKTSQAVSYFGEAWSVPSLYWWASAKKAEAKNRLSMGSGYAAPTSSDRYVSAAKGHHYYYYPDPTLGAVKVDKVALHDPAAVTPIVDTAVVADSATAINNKDPIMVVIATYQADLEGRIVRYDKGEAGKPYNVLAPLASRPFFYSPAVMHIGADATDLEVVLAANSCAADEAAACSARLYLKSESGGGAGSGYYDLDCAVGSISTCTDVTIGAGASSTDLPDGAARPTATPILVYNDPQDGSATERVEAFYLFYSKPTDKSYLVRIAVSIDTSTGKSSYVVEEAQKVGGRATGMMLAGGGTRVMLGKTGGGAGGTASMENFGKELDSKSLSSVPPRVEYWREVK